MTASTDQASHSTDSDRPLVKSFSLDTDAVLDGLDIGYTDAYVECELETRHERTERAIRQAQDQA